MRFKPLYAGLLLRASFALAISSAPANPAWADSTTAYCVLSRHDHTIPLKKGPCQFSQRQGNVNVRFKDWAFRFDADDNGLTYQRQASGDGLRFNREGHYTLMVYWQQPKP